VKHLTCGSTPLREIHIEPNGLDVPGSRDTKGGGRPFSGG
jgi:hypothetical protein